VVMKMGCDGVWLMLEPTVFTADVPSSLILVTLTMETIRSSETSVLTRATRRHITEDDGLYEIGNGMHNA
jgi:hypothetical protein